MNNPMSQSSAINITFQQCQRLKDFSEKGYTGDDGEKQYKSVDENLAKLYHVKFNMDSER